MSQNGNANDLGQYTFFPYFRRGLTTKLTNPEGSGGVVPSRAALFARAQVDIELNGQTANPPANTTNSVDIQLYGPGDIVSFDSRHVIRTEPTNGTTNFEPNYFPGIEFDQPDFPWTFTPVAPTNSSGHMRLRPWIVLIVLKDDEYMMVASSTSSTLSAISVTKSGVLPDLSQAWAWAHVQATGSVSNQKDLAALVEQEPTKVISRLICPRSLEADTHYTAFVVPTFEAGVQAGLRSSSPSAGASTVPSTGPAWSGNGDSQDLPTLPYYYKFEFWTSDSGDFETLVRAIRAMPVPAGVGVREFEVDNPGWGMPPAGNPLELWGALIPPIPPKPGSNANGISCADGTYTGDDWNSPEKGSFQDTLSGLLNFTSTLLDQPTGPDPIVAPPIYGRWHAAVRRLYSQEPPANSSGSAPDDYVRWLSQLNLDPRTRTVAGLGTRVVQSQRDSLMASAWAQISGINEANKILRQAQLARGVMSHVLAKHFPSTSPESIIVATSRVHSRVLVNRATVSSQFVQSPVPPLALSGAFCQVIRPLGPIRRRQGIHTTFTSFRPFALITALNSGLIIAPVVLQPAGLQSMDDLSAQAQATANLSSTAKAALGQMRFANLAPQKIESIPPNATFSMAAVIGHAAGQSSPSSGGNVKDSPDAQAFRTALIELTQVIVQTTTSGVGGVAIQPLSFDDLSQSILGELSPKITIPSRVASLVQVAGWFPLDPLEEVMWAPEFPSAMYEPLASLSQDYMIPGLENVPKESMTIMQENRVFLESYMVGLNVEMARQLLWNDFPTDQRGSYFRWFWESRPFRIFQNLTNSSQMADISPIHTWAKVNSLGSNKNPANPAQNSSDYLILLIKSKLFKRYPNATVYACQEKTVDPDKSPELSSNERFPIIQGSLPPDTRFFGFDLSYGQITADPIGWFFVIQQHPNEARFGTETRALSTEQLNTPAFVDALSYNDSADAAAQTFRDPVRIAILGSVMLQSDGGGTV